MTSIRDFRRGRPEARWSEPELAEVVMGVLTGAPDVLWSADDVRERLAFGREGGGPAATSVRGALRALEGAGASSGWRSGGPVAGARPTRSGRSGRPRRRRTARG